MHRPRRQLASPRRPGSGTRAGIAGLAVGLLMVAMVATSAQAAPVSPPTSPRPAPAAPRTVTQALSQAQLTDQPVPVDSATTDTDTLTANPDGSLTLSRSMLPVRKHVAGVWKSLDATLAFNPDGTLATTTTSEPLTLSGGGDGPLATMTASGGYQLAFSLPVTLPTPTIAGPTATYTDILAGVDLQVTADAFGDWSSVFIIRDPAAASNPALSTLTFTAHGNGITVTDDGHGNLAGTDPHGHILFTAPAPTMWDSTSGGSTPQVRSADGTTLDAHTGAAAKSSTSGPGEGAHVAAVGVTTTGSSIQLHPNKAMLTASTTTWPVYIDPWVTTTKQKSGWATVAQQFGSTNYWDSTPDPEGLMQVGYSGSILSRTLLSFQFPSAAYGSAVLIDHAALNLTETHSWSCTASDIDVYAPSTTLTSSNATWNYWNGVNKGSIVDSQTVAHGYSSSCPAAGVGFDVTSTIKADAHAASYKSTQTFLLKAGSEGDTNSWKEFTTAATLDITYDNPPDAPSSLSTSPATVCTAATPTSLGDGPVTLNAHVSDKDGGSLSVYFSLWKSSDTAKTRIWPTTGNPLTYLSGSAASTTVPEATLKAVAGSALTEFSWNVAVSDGTAATVPSADTCNFNFDPTRPGAPTVTLPPPDSGGRIGTVGVPLTISITKNDSPTAPQPTAYQYQVNANPPTTVAADASGNASITVTPNRFTNTVTVIAQSAVGNVGDSGAKTFTSNPPTAVGVEGDLSGDGQADLLTAGAGSISDGLWLAAGNNTGTVAPTPTDIGAYGNGLAADNQPADFNGSQPISGRFTGSTLQDVLAYYPNTALGEGQGDGVVLNGNGDGSPILANNGNEHLVLLMDKNTDASGSVQLTPLQIASAGDASELHHQVPDLISIAGDTFNGYYLSYYQAQSDQFDSYQQGQPLQTTTPGSSTDMSWNQWTIATAVIGSGTNTTTDMFLWNQTTGALWLWTNLFFDGSGSLTYTAYTLDDGTTGHTFNKAANIALHAADINADGNPDLWTVAGNTISSNLVTNLAAGTGTITTQPATTTLLTGDHIWQLGDIPAGTSDGTTVTTPLADNGTTATALPATASGGTQWNTDDLFSPDVTFDGTSGSHLATSSAAVNTSSSFTASAWVNPLAGGGTFLSQDGSNTAAVKAWVEPSDNSWRVAMSTSNVASPTWNTASTGPNSVDYGAWTHVTITYDQNAGTVSINAAGTNGHAAHTTTWQGTAAFQIGGSSHTSWFHGQLSTIQTWASALAPAGIIGTAAIYGILPSGQLTYTTIDVGTGKRIRTLISANTLGFTPKSVATLNANTLLINSGDSHLRRVDITANTDSLTFAAPVDLGTGWGGLNLLTFDGSIHLYGIITNGGTLRRYDVGKPKPAAADITNFTTIDTGFGAIATLTYTGTLSNADWLLATTTTGALYSYQVTGPASWTRYILANSGWGGPNLLTSPGAGIIYANSGQAMYHYLDLNPLDGNGSDMHFYLTDPVDTSGWTQTAISAQPNTVR